MRSNLRAIRLARGLSQRQLALKVGITQGMIAHIEVGRSRPSLDLALQLAQALDCPIGELFLPDTEDTPPPAAEG
jgi:putative transcriptional regulator